MIIFIHDIHMTLLNLDHVTSLKIPKKYKNNMKDDDLIELQ